MSVLEISELNCHIASYRGFITLSVKGDEVKRIPYDQVSAIITRAHGISYTQNLLVKLAEYNIPVVITNKSFLPVSMILPIGAHHATSQHLSAQASTLIGFQNQLWQQLIKRKVAMQRAVLNKLNISNTLSQLLPQINSGDSRNIEAQAARYYWGKLFHTEFRRQREGDTPNDMLNYGYTIFRSALARQVCATGLHPSLGIHHKHPKNTFCLVDDLIEPFRPIIDLAVIHCLENGLHQLDKEVKLFLVKQLTQRVKVGSQWVTIDNAMQILAQSLSQAYLNKKAHLTLLKTNLEKIDFSRK